MPNYTSQKIANEFEKLETRGMLFNGTRAISCVEAVNLCDEIVSKALEEQKAEVVRRLERQKERIYPEDDMQAQEWKGAQNDHIDMLIKGLDKEPIIIDNFTGGYQPKERLTTLQ